MRTQIQSEVKRPVVKMKPQRRRVLIVRRCESRKKPNMMQARSDCDGGEEGGEGS
jgi:hypothetical protein